MMVVVILSHCWCVADHEWLLPAAHVSRYMTKLSTTKLGHTNDRPLFTEMLSSIAGKKIFRVRRGAFGCNVPIFTQFCCLCSILLLATAQGLHPSVERQFVLRRSHEQTHYES